MVVAKAAKAAKVAKVSTKTVEAAVALLAKNRHRPNRQGFGIPILAGGYRKACGHDPLPARSITTTDPSPLLPGVSPGTAADGPPWPPALPDLLALVQCGCGATSRGAGVGSTAMIRALITGKLHDTPQARTSTNGNTFAIAKVKADDKAGAWVWVSVIAFGAESERLLELKAGDAVAIGGRAELSVWQDRDGNHHPGLSLVADEIATLRGKPKPRSEGEPRNPSQPPRRRNRTREPEAAGDGIPFDDALPDFAP